MLLTVNSVTYEREIIKVDNLLKFDQKFDIMGNECLSHVSNVGEE